FQDDGRDGIGGVAGRRGDGDAGRQREPGDRVDHAGGVGEGAAVRDPRRRPNGRSRYGSRNYSVAKSFRVNRLCATSSQCSARTAKRETTQQPKTERRPPSVWK